MRAPTMLLSGNVSIPYEWRQTPLKGEQATMFNCRNIHYCRVFNGQVSDVITDRWFFNEAQFNSCLNHWNRLGDSMSKKPSPIDNQIYHWQYYRIEIVSGK